jgi:large subunit ribosomal protein L22
MEELAAQSSASARFIWVSPYKVREVAVLIRAKHIDEARRILAFTPKEASRHLAKVLESAVANAEHNHQIPQEELVVRAAWADEGPAHRRAKPRARGARNLIRRRTSHIHVVLERATAPLEREIAPQPAIETAAPQEPEPRRRSPRARKSKTETKEPTGKRATRTSARKGAASSPRSRATKKATSTKTPKKTKGDK